MENLELFLSNTNLSKKQREELSLLLNNYNEEKFNLFLINTNLTSEQKKILKNLIEKN